MKNTSKICALAAAAVLSAAAALAHSGATGIVKERMDAMSAMAKASKSLSRITRGIAEYDPARIRADARTLQAHSGQELTRMFPEGTLAHPSEAAPSIWQDWERFSSIAARLSKLAQGLELAADNGLSGDQTAIPAKAAVAEIGQLPADRVFSAVARTCNRCHKNFRIEQ